MELIPVAEDSTPPFARDGKFHVRLTEGRFQNLRRLVSWPLISLFFGFVWVQVDGQPWLLFSLEQRRIILFGYPLLWHDLPILAGLMIAGACLLFFMAVAWGRVWCGFACPQSIWTWMFIRIEQFIEGPARKRAKLEGEPLRGERLLRRVIKHALWFGLALFTVVTFTGYFVPVRSIVTAGMNGEMSAHLVSWLIIMTGLTYLNAGLIREKICLHACPYSRFQGVMFDQHTLTVSYDRNRGEPRASQRSLSVGKGDCVDCNICVQVCPTGIDIRDGLQAACIDCGACIDACDRVMTRLGRPLGLIAFTSEALLTRHAPRFLRPRLLGYGVVMVFSLTAVLYGLAHTSTLVAEIERSRGALFSRVDHETICNDYRLKVEGTSRDDALVRVSLLASESFELIGPSEIDLADSSSSWLPYRVCTRISQPPRKDIGFQLVQGKSTITKSTTFISALI